MSRQKSVLDILPCRAGRQDISDVAGSRGWCATVRGKRSGDTPSTQRPMNCADTPRHLRSVQPMIIGPKDKYGPGRLKKYAASSANGRHTLVITIEYPDAGDMGYDVSGLDKILQEDRAQVAELKAATKQAKQKRISKPARLALPAPGAFR